jgi:hypothetical protein
MKTYPIFAVEASVPAYGTTVTSIHPSFNGATKEAKNVALFTGRHSRIITVNSFDAEANVMAKKNEFDLWVISESKETV